MTAAPQPNDLFAFALKDGAFGAMVCTQIMGKRKPDYRFAPVIGHWKALPSLEAIRAAALPVVRIQSTIGRQRTASMQPGVEDFWDRNPSSAGFFIGLAELTITADNWLKIEPQVKKIGELFIRGTFNTMGALQSFETFQELLEIACEIEHWMKDHGWLLYPVKSLTEQA